MGETRIGTVDIPERIEREKYFETLGYLELSALFTAPLKPSSLAKWAEIAGERAIGLVAPWVLTHRTKPEVGDDKTWHHDASVGDFRDSAHGRSALAMLRSAAEQIKAACVIFKSPNLFAPSSANRDQLKKFFTEVATEEAVGGVPRVWVPDGLWEPKAAVTFATELGITCAIDPLVVDPNEPYALEDLEVASIYFRVENLGRAGTLRSEDLEDLAAIMETYDDVIVAFASAARWADARNLQKLVSEK